MSMHVYRRGERSALRVPVVLPQVDVDVDEEGRLDVRLDGRPYAAGGSLGRGDLQRVVTGIAVERNSAVRVDVREVDGATFTDIITPPADEPPAATATDDEPSELPRFSTAAGEVSRAGFGPGEQVAVVVVVAQVVADSDGTAWFRLPPSLAAAHEILLVSHPADSAVVGAA